MTAPKVLIEETGNRYGLLLVESRAENLNGRRSARWNCLCDCGKRCVVRGDALRAGVRSGCGCGQKRGRHGDSGNGGTSEYRSWRKMIQRCTNPKHAGFENYGGRGISVCERWLNSYEAFLADMGRKPTPKHTIDRVDNDGNYEPGNCCWATEAEQRRKTTRTKLTTETAAEIRRRRAGGETGTSLAAEFNVDQATVYRIGYGERWA